MKPLGVSRVGTRSHICEAPQLRQTVLPQTLSERPQEQSLAKALRILARPADATNVNVVAVWPKARVSSLSPKPTGVQGKAVCHVHNFLGNGLQVVV